VHEFRRRKIARGRVIAHLKDILPFAGEGTVVPASPREEAILVGLGLLIDLAAGATRTIQLGLDAVELLVALLGLLLVFLGLGLETSDDLVHLLELVEFLGDLGELFVVDGVTLLVVGLGLLAECLDGLVDLLARLGDGIDAQVGERLLEFLIHGEPLLQTCAVGGG